MGLIAVTVLFTPAFEDRGGIISIVIRADGDGGQTDVHNEIAPDLLLPAKPPSALSYHSATNRGRILSLRSVDSTDVTTGVGG